MNFNDLDAKMRVYEQSLEQTIPPENYLIARIDGRNFTRLTKEICKFDTPFDEHFNNMMVETVKGLVAESDMEIIYGYTQSDEISLLFARDAQVFGRKVRKLNSILAGAASARFSLQAGVPAVFDCRIIPLPNNELVKDYFRWRMKDAHRNCLNSWCYWTLRKEGLDAAVASDELKGKSIAYKNELLFQRGINFNDFPVWQKRGVAVYWRNYEKTGRNPVTEKDVTAIRREIYVDYDIPVDFSFPTEKGQKLKRPIVKSGGTGFLSAFWQSLEKNALAMYEKAQEE